MAGQVPVHQKGLSPEEVAQVMPLEAVVGVAVVTAEPVRTPGLSLSSYSHRLRQVGSPLRYALIHLRTCHRHRYPN